MNEISYIPQSERKKILLLCDDINLLSGVATMAREIVFGTSTHFNWVNLGSGINHPHHNKRIDLSQKCDDVTGNKGSQVISYPYNTYGDPNILRSLLKKEKPDAIMIFTDPRYWDWLFRMENEIRKQCPIMYYNIWDSTPIPLWNKPFYESCDALFGISKQTVNINKVVLGDLAKEKIIKYIPHGINPKYFYPIDDEKIINNLKIEYFGKIPKFVAFFNSRNIRRKSIPDLLLAWKSFQDSISEEEREETVLLMHTDPVDNGGTDLNQVIEALFGFNSNVIISSNKLNVEDMNKLYNLADVTILPSSNEGWGLSLTESMMVGVPIIANVTGGMQDQMRFEDENGKWIEFSEEFPSNHFGKYKVCGEWALPVFPSTMSLLGSPQTPYIFDDKLDFRELSNEIKLFYGFPKPLQKLLGNKAREWVLSDESMMSSNNMCFNMVEAINETINNFKPKPSFSIIKYEDRKPNQLNHPIIY